MPCVVQGQVQVVHINHGVGRLVLGNRVDERIPSLRVLHEQPSDAGRHGTEVPHWPQQGRNSAKQDNAADHDLDAEQHKLARGHLPAPPRRVAERQHLVPQEGQERAHLLKGPERRPANGRDLDRTQRADRVEQGVGPVDAGVEPAQGHKHGRVDADHVDHEDVASPGGHHVDVGKARQDPVRPRAGRPHGPQPEPEGHADRRHCHRLVIELPAH
mmetsp:Transcript_112440/g.318083  ORF Transcript_112440/g.318083 Transcript_112440/m.318083 type:complete len:215 (+) Transcript_112440:790-1434(+)